MSDLNTNILIHKIPLTEENIPMKQKLGRTRPDKVLKVKPR
jgi:hypothetical protein